MACYFLLLVINKELQLLCRCEDLCLPINVAVARPSITDDKSILQLIVNELIASLHHRGNCLSLILSCGATQRLSCLQINKTTTRAHIQYRPLCNLFDFCRTVGAMNNEISGLIKKHNAGHYNHDHYYLQTAGVWLACIIYRGSERVCVLLAAWLLRDRLINYNVTPN